MKRYPSIIVVIVLSFVFVANAIAAQEWLTRKSIHFIVYYKKCSQSFLDKLISQAEKNYKDIASELRFFIDEPWIWEERAKIYVYDNKNEYLQSTGMPEWSVGSARPFEKTVYTYAESHKFFGHTLTHELTHLILRQFIGRKSIPLWFEEGVAVYMERRKNPAAANREMRKLIKNDQYLPFDDFFNMQFYDLDKERNPEEDLRGLNLVDKFYLQSFSMVYFLIKEYQPYRFSILLRKIREGKRFEEAFPDVYRAFKDTARLEKKWKEFYK